MLDTGLISNHVNIVRNAHGQFAYVTVGGLNEVLVFRTSDFSKVATIPVGELPHGIRPSGDGTRVYVGFESDDRLVAIDTLTNTVIGRAAIGQAPQAVVYVPDAVPEGARAEGLQPLGLAGNAVHFTLVAVGDKAGTPSPTSVTLYDQGLVQILGASATGLAPKHPYVLAISDKADGSGTVEALSAYMTNPAGAAIVNAVGPIRQVVAGTVDAPRRYLVIVAGTPADLGSLVQLQGF